MQLTWWCPPAVPRNTLFQSTCRFCPWTACRAPQSTVILKFILRQTNLKFPWLSLRSSPTDSCLDLYPTARWVSKRVSWKKEDTRQGTPTKCKLGRSWSTMAYHIPIYHKFTQLQGSSNLHSDSLEYQPASRTFKTIFVDCQRSSVKRNM